MAEHFAQIAFESQVGLVPQSAGEIVHNIEGRISVMVNNTDDEEVDDEDTDDEVDPERPAGVMEFCVVPLAEIRRRGMNLWEVFDADSGALADVYDSLPEEICESADSLLFIHSLEVDEQFRQPGFATRIVETVIATFAPLGVCIAWDSGPVGVDSSEWGDLRFERLGDSDFMIRTSEVAEGLEL